MKSLELVNLNGIKINSINIALELISLKQLQYSTDIFKDEYFYCCGQNSAFISGFQISGSVLIT